MEGLSERGGRRSGAGRPKGIKVPYSALSLPKEDIEALRKLAHRNRFIREYFRFDLSVKNAKVRYLNRALGRNPEKDTVVLDEDATEEMFDEASRLDSILHGKDILERERGIDDLIWGKIDDLTTYDYFDIEAILGFLAKLHIVERWYTLDEQTGREMFRKLVDEVRGTFKGVRGENSPCANCPTGCELYRQLQEKQRSCGKSEQKRKKSCCG